MISENLLRVLRRALAACLCLPLPLVLYLGYLAPAELAADCAERVRLGACLVEPEDMARRCRGFCGVLAVESAERRRTTLAGVINASECAALVALGSRASVLASGYKDGGKYVHSPFETFSGTTPKQAADWAQLQPSGELRETARAGVEAYVRAARALHKAVEHKLAEVDPSARELHADYIHLVCRERDERIKVPDDEIPRLSHSPHADNCRWNLENKQCERKHPAYWWRTHSAVLFLHETEHGGDFFYADAWDPAADQRAYVPAACGRAVAFTAGPENTHGVSPVTRGLRCALLMWFTTDEERALSKDALNEAAGILQEMPAEAPRVSDEFHGLCTASDAEGESPAQSETVRELGGRRLVLRELHDVPQVTKIGNFLSDEEIRLLIDEGVPRLRTSTVFENGQITTAQYRNSETGWINHDTIAAKPLLQGVLDRIGLVTGLSLDSAEALQIAFYDGRNRGKYDPHMDWGVGTSVSRNFKASDVGHESYQGPVGARLATFLMYLNDVEAGGYTVFPELGIRVRPERGSALLFYNLIPRRQGLPVGDRRLRHGACPCERGNKYISTLWLHEGGNVEAVTGVLEPGFEAGRLSRDWEGLTFVATRVASSDNEADEASTAAHQAEDAGGSCADASPTFTDPLGRQYSCEDYADFGYCRRDNKNYGFMKTSCRRTCGFCVEAAGSTEEL